MTAKRIALALVALGLMLAAVGISERRALVLTYFRRVVRDPGRPFKDVEWAAVRLSALADRSGVPELLSALERLEREGRERGPWPAEVVKALGNLGDAAVAPALARALDGMPSAGRAGAGDPSRHVTLLFATIARLDPRLAAESLGRALDLGEGGDDERTAAFRGEIADVAVPLYTAGLLPESARQAYLEASLDRGGCALALSPPPGASRAGSGRVQPCALGLSNRPDMPAAVTVVAGTGVLLLDGVATPGFEHAADAAPSSVAWSPGALNPMFATRWLGCAEEAACPDAVALAKGAREVRFRVTLALVDEKGNVLATRARTTRAVAPVAPR